MGKQKDQYSARYSRGRRSDCMRGIVIPRYLICAQKVQDLQEFKIGKDKESSALVRIAGRSSFCR